MLYHFEDFREEYMRRVEAGENPFKEVINNENALKVNNNMRISVY